MPQPMTLVLWQSSYCPPAAVVPYRLPALSNVKLPLGPAPSEGKPLKWWRTANAPVFVFNFIQLKYCSTSKLNVANVALWDAALDCGSIEVAVLIDNAPSGFSPSEHFDLLQKL